MSAAGRPCDAAILVNPYDVGAIKQAIITVDADQDLCAALEVRGRQRAKLFSPDAYCERVAKVYAPYT
jgi:glycosyltransferase involved in cell wall biosynthesis